MIPKSENMCVHNMYLQICKHAGKWERKHTRLGGGAMGEKQREETAKDKKGKLKENTLVFIIEPHICT